MSTANTISSGSTVGVTPLPPPPLPGVAGAATINSTNPKDKGYLQDLVRYMNEVMIALVQLTQSQSALNKQQSEVQAEFNKLAQQQIKTAEDNLEKLQAAIEAASHASWWQKALGYVLGGLMALAGVASGNVGLVVMSTAMLSMQASGGTDKLNQLLDGLPLGLKILANVGLAAGLAATSMGVSAGAATLADAAGVTAEGTGANAVGLTARNFTASFMQSTAVFNWITPGMIASWQKMTGSDETGQMIGEILGMLTGFGIAGVGLGVDGGTALSRFAADSEAYLVQARKAILVLTAGSQIAQGSLGVLKGVAILDQANAIRAQGDAQGSLLLFQGLLSIFGANQSQTTQTVEDTNRSYADINNRWNSFVQPFAHESQIMA